MNGKKSTKAFPRLLQQLKETAGIKYVVAGLLIVICIIVITVNVQLTKEQQVQDHHTLSSLEIHFRGLNDVAS